MKELELAFGIDDDQPVGLGHLRGDLRQVFGARHPHRDRQSQFGPHATADRLRNFNRRTEETHRARDVGESLVDGDTLDERREVAHHPDRGIAQPLVVAEVAADESEFRTELAGPPSRHPATHPEAPRFVGSGEHHAAADRDGPAPERGVEQLLDRGVEGVEIRVKDGGRRCHSEVPAART